MTSNSNNDIRFTDLGLSEEILKALDDLGYEKPSPIQTECIPLMLDGRDVLGMAQTGSGKTAAFALPMLMNIDQKDRHTQILVLAPTRELAIQVAESCESYAKHMKDVDVLALYGGQRYDVQLRALRKGAQIVVGTPGRLLDHLKKGTLDLSRLKCLVLDEADEMLRMGFIEDVEAIMSATPAEHQTALFSATMPEPIRRITRRFMNDPQEIKIKVSVRTAPDITQSYWRVYGARKNDALVRFLEMEDFDAAIVFVRTKTATLEVAEALEKNGYNSAALNGDMNQALREQTLDRLKDGRLDILIATDVAARGLDVDRISLVVNYDIPMDSESYIHRIGRTGRAGRAGKALLFVENRERRLLQNIERLMKLSIPEVDLPSGKLLVERRLEKFSKKIKQQLENEDLGKFVEILDKLNPNGEIELQHLAAALLKLAQGERSLLLKAEEIRPPRTERSPRSSGRFENNSERRRNRDGNSSNNSNRDNSSKESRHRGGNSTDMDVYRIEIGKNDGVEARHIVGAIANEGDISSRNIGHIKLYDEYSTIELPKEMPKDLQQHFKKVRVLNKQMQMKLIQASTSDKKTPYSDRKAPSSDKKTSSPKRARHSDAPRERQRRS